MQVWVIRRKKDGHLLPPMDGEGAFMAWRTEEEAKKGFEYQSESYELLEDGDEWEVVNVGTE